MVIFRNGQYEQMCNPRYEKKKIVVAIDSSKTNSAFTVSDMHGNILDYYEFNGKADGTATVDTLHLCQQERKALKDIFLHSDPQIVGIEDIITKTSKNKKTGLDMHTSRFKITAVFMSFISFFQDEFNVTPELINNQEWKSHVLPAEFRTREYDKGSLAYFKSINSKYQYCSDDVTDSICILRYLCMIHNIKAGILIEHKDVSRIKHAIRLCPPAVKLNNELVFLYNNSLTLEENAVVMSNTLIGKPNKFAVSTVSVNDVEILHLYKYCKGITDKVSPTLKLVVANA